MPRYLSVLILWLIYTTAQAATYTYHLPLDTNNTPQAGCTLNINQSAAESITGVDYVLKVYAQNDTNPAAVTQVTLQTCSEGRFAAEQVIDPGTWPVGIGKGLNGGDVIEAALPFEALGYPFQMTVQGALLERSGGYFGDAADALLFIVDPPEPIPALSTKAAFLLGILLLIGAFILLRRMPRQNTTLSLFVIVLCVGVGGAYIAQAFTTIILDGEVEDWSGINPLNTVPVGDASTASPAEQLQALFATSDQQAAYFRLDVAGGYDAPVLPENTPPVADAGSDQSVTVGAVVTLDGSGSSDADGDALSYQWTLSAPAGSNAALSNATTANPSFTADVAGSYSAELVVNDGMEDSAPDTVIITVANNPTGNTPPVADAGPDRSVTIGTVVALDGSGSSDADGDALSYQWTLTVPAGSNAVLSNATTANPSFTADVAGEYSVELVVNDGTEDSAPDSIIITASNTPAANHKIEFLTDEALYLTKLGETAQLQVQVLDANGQLVPQAQVSWESSDPAIVMVTPQGPLTSTVTATSFEVKTVTITVRYGVGNSIATASIILAEIAPSVVVIESGLVQSITGDRLGRHTIVLSRNSQTEALSAGQIVISGNQAGLMARVVSKTMMPDTVEIQADAVPLTDAFKSLELHVVGDTNVVTSDSIQNSAVAPFSTKNTSEQIALSGLKCEAGGFSGVIEPRGGSIGFDLETNGEFDLVIDDFSVERFIIKVKTNFDFGADAGTVEFSGSIDTKIQCLKDLAKFEIPAIITPFFNFDFTIIPAIGVEVSKKINTPNLEISGPQGFMNSFVEGGLEYTSSSGWDTIAEKGFTGEFKLFDTASDLNTEFEASIAAILVGKIGAQSSIGRGILSFPLAEAEFAKLEGKGELGIKIEEPVISDNPEYTGPNWRIGAGLKGAFEAELFKGFMEKVSSFIGIKTKVEAQVVFLDAFFPLLSSPVPILTVDCLTDGCPADPDKNETVAFTATTTDTDSEGVAEFWINRDGGNILRKIDEAGFASGTGTGSWQPTNSDCGEYQAYPRLKVDALSEILPYASDQPSEFTVCEPENEVVLPNCFVDYPQIEPIDCDYFSTLDSSDLSKDYGEYCTHKPSPDSFSEGVIRRRYVFESDNTLDFVTEEYFDLSPDTEHLHRQFYSGISLGSVFNNVNISYHPFGIFEGPGSIGISVRYSGDLFSFSWDNADSVWIWDEHPTNTRLRCNIVFTIEGSVFTNAGLRYCPEHPESTSCPSDETAPCPIDQIPIGCFDIEPFNPELWEE